jgi:phosphoacetylglucosamine mutase
MIKYGTSGFRSHHNHIEKIAIQIGTAMALLTCYKKESFGIMITASHNHHEDNGVKIMDQHGNMVSNDIETYLEHFVNNLYKVPPNESLPFRPATDIDDMDINDLKQNNIQISIGYDSRESSPRIAKLIQNGILRTNLRFPNQIYPHVTTPELHYLFAKQEITYINYLQRCVNQINYPCVIDCANGIGSKKMLELKKRSISLINTSWTAPNRLNHECSSDFVCSQNK